MEGQRRSMMVSRVESVVELLDERLDVFLGVALVS